MTIEQQREWLALLEAELARREQEAARNKQQAAEEAASNEDAWLDFFEELLEMGQRMLAPAPPGWRVPRPEVLTELVQECVRTPDWRYINTLRNLLNLSANQVVGLVMTVDPEVAIRLFLDFP